MTVDAAWSRMAHAYHATSVASRAHRDKIDQVAREVLATDATEVIDLGCGSGVVEQRLLQLGFAGRVRAFDGSEKMLELARHGLAQGANSERRTTFTLADLNQPIPCADSSFDCAVAINVMCWLTNQPTFLNECARVLRSGGTLVLVNPKANADGLWVFVKEHFRGETITQALHDVGANVRVLPSLVRLVWHQRRFDRLHAKGAVTYHDRRTLEAMLVDAGFSVQRAGEIQARQNWLLVAKKL